MSTIQSGGIEANSVHSTFDPKEFPERPETMGAVTAMPPATMPVPVEIHGNPPVIAFNARYLADALECLGRDSGATKSRSASRMARAERGHIGSTLCLSDELSTAICRHTTGCFCVIMPMRVTIPAGTTRDVEAATPHHHAQAAA